MLSHHIRQFIRQAENLFLILALGHHADQRFGAGFTYNHPTGRSKLLLGSLDRLGERLTALPVLFALRRDPDIDHGLRIGLDKVGEFAEFFAAALQQPADLHGGKLSVAGGAVIEENDVSRLLAAHDCSPPKL